MKHRPESSRIAIVVSAIILVGLASCRTVPETEGPDVLGWLPPESDLVMRLSVPENRDLAMMLLSRSGFDPAELSGVLDRAELVVLGIERSDEGSAFHLVSVGNWPRGLMGGALGGDWDKVSRYRWMGPEGVEIAVPTKSELIYSSGKTDLMLERAEGGAPAEVIAQVDPAGESGDLQIWITSPSELMESAGILGSMATAGPEIDEIGLVLRKNNDGTYGLRLTISPSDPSMAQRLLLPMRLGMSARFGLSPVEKERNLLKQMEIVAEDGEVITLIPSLELDVMDTLLLEMGLAVEEDME